MKPYQDSIVCNDGSVSCQAEISVCAARLSKKNLYLSGAKYRVARGAWAFYVPDLQVKIFHCVDGQTHCLHHSAPDKAALLETGRGLANETYSVDEWISALTKPVLLRAAENFIAAKRLFRAGLGPDVKGFLLIPLYRAGYASRPTINVGLFIDDLTEYQAKPDCSVEEIKGAGVIPDRIHSCVRQQINGYVSDLNSVVGVMPENAEAEILDLYRQLSFHMDAASSRLSTYDIATKPKSAFLKLWEWIHP